MRTFLAVSLPGDVAHSLYQERTKLRQAWSGVRWVVPENFHITVLFFGEIDQQTQSRIAEVISSRVSSIPAFTIEFSGPDCFGGREKPKLIFERIVAGVEGLRRLHRLLYDGLEGIVDLENRPYRPHLTLGRPRRRGIAGPASGGLLPDDTPINRSIGFTASEVVFYQSELSAQGAQYRPLKRWSLEVAQ